MVQEKRLINAQIKKIWKTKKLINAQIKKWKTKKIHGQKYRR